MSQALSLDNIRECKPKKAADGCSEVYGGDLVTWQESADAGRFDWRKVKRADDGTFKVTLLPKKLNAGFIPTAKNQGHYKSKKVFGKQLSLLLGVGSDKPFQIVQIGSTTKVDADRKGLSSASTGNFIFDALSDEDGRVFIAGKEIAWNPDTVHTPNAIGDTSESQATVQTLEQGITLRDGDTQADLDAWKHNFCWYQSIGSELDNYERDGEATHKEFYWSGGWFPWFRTVDVKAGSMSLRNNKYRCDDRTGYCTVTEMPSKVGYNTDSLELKAASFGFPGCSDIWLADGVCAHGEVRGGGFLGGSVGAGNTPDGCGGRF